MGSKRAFAISSRRRGLGRVAVVLSVLALGLTGCGRSGQGAKTDPEKAGDVEVLNVLLAQELTALEAYDRVLPLLRGRPLAVTSRFRADAQAYADAMTKAIRGVGGETEAEAAEVEEPAPKTQEDALLLAYETENASLAQALDASPRLETPAPRTLTAALAASHAQHVAALRQLLGASLEASVAGIYETGDEPPPGQPAEGG